VSAYTFLSFLSIGLKETVKTINWIHHIFGVELSKSLYELFFIVNPIASWLNFSSLFMLFTILDMKDGGNRKEEKEKPKEKYKKEKKFLYPWFSLRSWVFLCLIFLCNSSCTFSLI